MSEEIAVSIKNVSKHFKLPHESANSVKSLFVNPFNPNRRKFEVQHALRNISLDIKKGEFFGIVGRNGSGKSTLLKIIAGIYQPNKGEIKVNGRLVPFIELGVGFNPELTGRENVYLNGALLGFSEKEIDAKYEAIVDFAELERFMDQKLKNYSSGMQVRLAFSVATMLAESDILLIDEVLAVGDADFQRKCFEYFKKLKREKKTVVFISHDMSAIREYCDRAALINDSRLMAIGETDKIAQKYTKLFANTNDVETGKESMRWGKGDIKTVSIDVLMSDNTLTIKQCIKSKHLLENPIFGVRVRSTSGNDILGTNTQIENIKTGIFEAGNEKILVWTMPLILADGQYFIDPAIIDPDGITVQDWWDEAIKFKVTKERHLPYFIDPGFNIEFVNRQVR